MVTARARLREALNDGELLDRVVRPQRFSRYEQMATRTGQWLAAIMLGPLIIVSFAVITAFNQVLAGILGAGGHPDSQAGIAGFLVTAITLGAVVLAAWAWFQWVRTAGFCIFNVEV